MKLQPQFVKMVRQQSQEIEDGSTEEPRGPDIDEIVRIWEAACPQMHQVLTQEGILKEYANVLSDSTLQRAKAMPGDCRENHAQCRREMIPCYPEQEAEWLRLHALPLE